MVELGLVFSGICILAGVQNWLVYGQDALYKSARSFSYLAWSAGLYIALTSLEYLSRTPETYFTLIRFHSVATFLTSIFFLHFVQSTLGIRARWTWWVFIGPQGLILLARMIFGPEIFYTGATSLVFSPGIFVEHTAVIHGQVSWVYYAFALHILTLYCFLSFKIIQAYKRKNPGNSLGFLVAILVFDAGILNDLQVMILGFTQIYLTDFSFAGFIALTAIQLTRQAMETFRWKRQAASQEEVLNHLPFLIILTDPRGQIVYLNPEAQKEFERALWPQGTLAQWLAMALGPEEGRRVQEVLDRGETKWFRMVLGDRAWAGLAGQVTAGAILGQYLLLRDLTAEETMEKKYQQIQNMENLGILAGGLAHDFRNCLTSIQGAVDLARLRTDRLPPDTSKEILADLNLARSALDAANALVQKILNLGKSKDGEPTLVDLRTLVHEAVKLLQPRILGTVKVQTSLPENPAPVLVDHHAMLQAFLNLLQNALQAMEGGPRAAKAPGQLTLKVEDQGDQVLFQVQDQGVGMDETTLKKIFQPFFTTKPEGTGLGLAQVWSVVHRCQGTIEVQSKLGQGSTFTVRLPRGIPPQAQP